MKKLGADLSSKKIIYNNNPITKWCLTNTSVDIDKNGNIQPVKSNPKRRIDGLAAMLNAYVVLDEKVQRIHQPHLKGVSIWDYGTGYLGRSQILKEP